MQNCTIRCFQESSFPVPLPLGTISTIAKEWHPGQGMGVEKPLQPLAPVAPEMALAHYFLFLTQPVPPQENLGIQLAHEAQRKRPSNVTAQYLGHVW